MRQLSSDKFDKIAKKKKEWNPNPWAVCNVSVGTEKTPKRERCIHHVKDKQSMMEPIARSLPYVS